MIHVENSILIKGNIERVFEIVQDVEKYSEFMPEFKEAKIYPINDNKFIVERKAKIMNIPFRWKSIVIIKRNKSIKFEHIEGILKGMWTEWIFEVINGKTKIKVIHQFVVKIPVIGDMIGKLIIWNFFIKKISNKMLERLKKKIESEGELQGK